MTSARLWQKGFNLTTADEKSVGYQAIQAEIAVESTHVLLALTLSRLLPS